MKPEGWEETHCQLSIKFVPCLLCKKLVTDGFDWGLFQKEVVEAHHELDDDSISVYAFGEDEDALVDASNKHGGYVPFELIQKQYPETTKEVRVPKLCHSPVCCSVSLLLCFSILSCSFTLYLGFPMILIIHAYPKVFQVSTCSAAF